MDSLDLKFFRDWTSETLKNPSSRRAATPPGEEALTAAVDFAVDAGGVLDFRRLRIEQNRHDATCLCHSEGAWPRPQGRDDGIHKATDSASLKVACVMSGRTADSSIVLGAAGIR